MFVGRRFQMSNIRLFCSQQQQQLRTAHDRQSSTAERPGGPAAAVQSSTADTRDHGEFVENHRRRPGNFQRQRYSKRLQKSCRAARVIFAVDDRFRILRRVQ